MAKFWALVQRTEGCWEWLGAIDKRPGYGYGAWSWRDSVSGESKRTGAHRMAYWLTNGEIRQGLQVDHLCRNRICVNPAHMELVSPRENTMRGMGPSAENAKKSNCPRGHEYDATQPGRYGVMRYCWRCRAEQSAQSHLRSNERKRAAGIHVGIPTKERTHCPYGHEYDGVSRTGQRTCKACSRRKTAAYRARSKSVAATPPES